MKKIISLMSVLILFSSVFSTVVFSEVYEEIKSFRYENFEYYVKDDQTISISLYKGNESELVIPSEINGLVVTSIESDAFYENKNFSDITLPDTIRDIDMYTFSQTDYYKNQNNWEDGVFYIGKHLIKAKESLSGEYAVKEGTVYISSCAFIGCENLTNIIIPDSVQRIGDRAFVNTEYYNNDDNWENEVFYAGKHLIKAKETISGNYSVKDGTISISDFAFYDCSLLTNITFPSSISKIENRAFTNCKGLTEVVIPDSITNIREWVFSGCENLTNITIPDSVTTIGEGAFAGCRKLSSLTLPDSIACIGKSAFYDCVGLTEITVPDSVIKIGSRAFGYYMVDPLLIPQYGQMEHFTLIGYSGGVVEKYAQRYKMSFDSLGETSNFKIGDINCDGIIDIGDIVLLRASIVGNIDLNYIELELADKHVDNVVDAQDVVKIRYVILNN